MADTSNSHPSSEARVPMSHRMDSWDNVNQQNSSPLFNRIPPELRNLIFKFTLTEFTAPALDRPIKHDFSARDDHEKLDDEPDMETGPVSQPGDQGEHEVIVQTPDVENGQAPAVGAPPASFFSPAREMRGGRDWFRPGYTGQRQIRTALLGTCRRVYLETYMLPSQGSKIFYNAKGPRWCPNSPSKYVSGLAPGAARHIRNLQMFSQVWFLERELMDLVTGALSATSYFQRQIPLPTHPSWPVTNPQWVPPVAVPRLLTHNLYPRASTQHPPGFIGPSLWQEPTESPPRWSFSQAGRIRPWRLTEHITTLRIYLRRTDWAHWDFNAPLVINPFNPVTTQSNRQQMYESMRATVAADRLVEPRLYSSSPSIFPRWTCWGLLFLRMPGLQKLTIDFETSEDKKGEMETIVDWAHRHWRFPVLRRLSGDESDPYTFDHVHKCRRDSPVDLSPWSHDLDVFSAADEPVQKTSFRGLPHHFSGACHACGVFWNDRGVAPDCAECTKKEKLLALNKGPQLLVWTVNWKRKVPPRGPEPEANAGGEGSQGRGGQPLPGRAPDGRQDGAGPSSAESHVLGMLPEDAQYRTRRRRELDELMTREVTF